MSKQLSESEIIKLSLVLYPERVQREIREDATVLMASVHDWNSGKRPGFAPMFGEAMSYELLYRLGRWLNKEYPEG